MTSVVAGIDLAAGRGKTELAVLRVGSGTGPPLFHAGDHVAVSTDEEIVDRIARSAPTVVAIDAPLSLPLAVAAALHGTTADRSGARSASSPYTRAAERSPLWREVGCRPLPVSFLGGLTFRAISLLPALRAAAPAARIIEVFPTASLRRFGIAAGEGNPPARKRPAKTTPTSRQFVQDGLSRWIEGLPSPHSALLGSDLLDALAAALTAVLYEQGAYEAVGDADEGQIILPCISGLRSQRPLSP